MKAAAVRTEQDSDIAAPRGAGDPTDLLTRLRRDALHVLAAGPLYRHTLIGKVPGDLRCRLGERWPGDAKRGAAIFDGDIELCGETVRNPAPVWFPRSASPEWLAEWHGFTWIADLISVGDDAREAARALIQSWLRENTRWDPVAWRSDVIATRIYSWGVHLDEVAGRDADRSLRRAMLAGLTAQLRHLSRTAAWELPGAARLRALKGLIGGTVALDGTSKRLDRAVRLLERELPAQLNRDGGHRSRSPSLQLQVLGDLIDIRATLRAAGVEIPPPLQDAILRMAPMLRFFRHGDRRLALFNDAVEEDAVLVDLVLTRSEGKKQSPPQAPQTGFQRLHAGQSLVLVDTGRPPPGFDEGAHAGALSFELSQGRERIIVNCGGYRGAKSSWRRVARASAAHSVLVVEDTNAFEIEGGATAPEEAASVRCERAEDAGHQWMSAAHDGYRARFGLTYERELYLAPDGDDLRGEERLTGRANARFAVRFHLHPAVEASLVGDAAAALLRLPSGTVWRLRCAGAEMSLGESIYLGSGEAKKTQQVVLSGTTDADGATVRWALRREPKPAHEPQRDSAEPQKDSAEPQKD
ncbi:MAG TPA: heparinase II/III family protein [Stellaceae bacterium]|jgi:uncharacterized heparinase superfamily protein|nr:heparinase II/III family protein [Stellaceae bacterium]